MAEPRRSARPTWRVFFDLVFKFGCLAFAIVFVSYVVRVWFNPQGAQARKEAAAGSVTLPSKGDPSSQDYRKDLELLEKEIVTQDHALAGERDELTRITDISKTLITVAGVFAFLLGAASWKFLDDQQKAAKDTLEGQRKAAQDAFEVQERVFGSQIQNFMSDSKILLEKSLEESQSSLRQVSLLRDEVERDFPMFGRMRSNFGRILVGLQTACARLSDQDETYIGLSWDEVQRILFFENAISTALLLNTGDHSRQLAEIYRLLGLFYGSRFAWDKAGVIGEAPRDDLNRARFYFDRSIELDPQNYLTHLHAGYFTQFNDDLALARASRDYFKTAATLDKKYQKALISIALLELEAFKNPEAALAVLDAAAGRTSYDIDRSVPAINLISYLRACALSLRLTNTSGPPDPTTANQALVLLANACEKLSQYVCKNFDADTRSYFKVLKDFQSAEHPFGVIVEKVQSCGQLNSLPGYN